MVMGAIDVVLVFALPSIYPKSGSSRILDGMS